MRVRWSKPGVKNKAQELKIQDLPQHGGKVITVPVLKPLNLRIIPDKDSSNPASTIIMTLPHNI